MSDFFNSSGDYRVEVSGWGMDNSFFVEKTNLIWTSGDEKRVQLHRALPKGAIVFIRLVSYQCSSGPVPVACQVEGVLPMNGDGRCSVKLKQLHPRSRESQGETTASNIPRESAKASDVEEEDIELQGEEILQ